MIKSIVFAGALGALLLTSTAACVEPEPALDEDTSELTGRCFRGETCRPICFADGSGQLTCTEFCTLDFGPCEGGGEGGGSGSGGGGDCEDDADNAPDICPGGGGSTRFP